MARKGRVDRGLYTKPNVQGKVLWHVRLFHNGKGNKFGPFSTKTMARDFYEKCKREQREGQFFPERYHQDGYPLVVEWIDHYLTTLPGSGKTHKTQQEEHRYATWWKKRLAGKRLHHLVPENIEANKRELVEQGYAAQTVMHYLKFLRHVLNVAVRDKKLEKSPFAEVKMPKVLQGDTRELSMEEECRLLKAVGPLYGPWVRLAILTGLRQGEQFKLKWTDVDLERGIITLPQTKAGKCQYVLLNEEAKDILKTFTSWKDSKWVFPSKTKGTHLDPKNFYHRVYVPALRRANLKNVDWHTLRHTFASRLAMDGQSDSTIAALLRHSGTALVQRYAHLSPTHLRAAVESVANFGKEPGREMVSEDGSVGTAPPIAPQANSEGVKNA
jgi:site-specific recombinase XerD